MERRDPASGLLRLGVVLCALEREERSGVLKVEDQGRTHIAVISEGRVGEVHFNCDDVSTMNSLSASLDSPENLFAFVRPKIGFEERSSGTPPLNTVTVEQVILHGIVRRPDLFDPRPLQERIPLNVLKLEKEGLTRALTAGLSASEQEFLWSLRVPTPLVMALWKRGLPPRHAGALIVGLNLLSCFPSWAPGDLPRMTPVSTLLRKNTGHAPPHELLGVSSAASGEEIDRAFRRLSFDIHPDRLVYMAERDRRDAARAFELLSTAYTTLKSSRRSPAVRPHRASSSPAPDEEDRFAPWAVHVEGAKKAASMGSEMKAKMSALRALSMSPPPHIAEQLKQILRACA